LRSRSNASERMYAAASLTRLASIVSRGALAAGALAPPSPRGVASGPVPGGVMPIATGVAAPSVVAGAIAAMWLA
jgi:hypothetical protein